MSEEEINISKLETVLVNTFTPYIWAATLCQDPFEDIVESKINDYKRLVKYLERGEKIPFKVEGLYLITPCGTTALGTAYLRKYFLKTKTSRLR